jgi:hypothetical protein
VTYCPLGSEPIVPSIWWSTYLDEAIEINAKQCQMCSKLRTKIRDLVIRQKDKPEDRNVKNQQKQRHIKDTQVLNSCLFEIFFLYILGNRMSAKKSVNHKASF